MKHTTTGLKGMQLLLADTQGILSSYDYSLQRLGDRN